jgi:pimeloyl-ACP methyl ester carboxylesterase
MRGQTAALLEDLPARYRGNGGDRPPGRVRIVAGRVSRDVVLAPGSCAVEKLDGHRPDSEIVTDPETWRDIHEGRLSGIEAFVERRLWARGSIDALLRFETMFERPSSGGLPYAMEMIDVGGVRISTMIAGPPDAPPVLLLHGLGATKASWLMVVPGLAQKYRVIAPDLPGFGASDKPAGRYDAAWFAVYAFSLLDVLGHRNSFVVGNSMGGRVAMEMAMLGPERVDAIACLSPASAFAKRPGLWLAKVARPRVRIPRRPGPSRLDQSRTSPALCRLEPAGGGVVRRGGRRLPEDMELAPRSDGVLQGSPQHLSRRAVRRDRLLDEIGDDDGGSWPSTSTGRGTT